MTAARRAALDTLRGVRRGTLLDRALAKALDRVPPRDRPWTQELVYGTVRLQGRLDHMLDQLVRRGLDSLEADVLDVLRLGAYQLLEMGSVPPYAAVSQSVELAKAVSGRGAGGLVNGVLKALGRRRKTLKFPAFDDDPAGFLATWGSHPRWLVERWVGCLGADGARALVEANNRRPALYVRPVGMERVEAQGALDAAGIETEPVPFAPDALRVPTAPAEEVLAAVPAIVQDPAAGLVVRYAAVPAGSTVADLCAAPGGKALALSDAAGYVVAADVSVRRLARLVENVDRLDRRGRLGVVAADARQPPLPEGQLDAVLLDVPCTGTGTFRRHPDGKWRVTPRDLAALVDLQREILEAAAPLVRPGGLLIYATCSLEAEENEEQVKAFLARHPEYELAPPRGVELDSGLLDGAGRLRVLPHDFGVDGAFAARLQRTMEANAG